MVTDYSLARRKLTSGSYCTKAVAAPSEKPFDPTLLPVQLRQEKGAVLMQGGMAQILAPLSLATDQAKRAFNQCKSS